MSLELRIINMSLKEKRLREKSKIASTASKY